MSLYFFFFTLLVIWFLMINPRICGIFLVRKVSRLQCLLCLQAFDVWAIRQFTKVISAAPAACKSTSTGDNTVLTRDARSISNFTFILVMFH